MMYEAFVKETKIDLKKLFDTDIVDSYFVQKVGNDNLLCAGLIYFNLYFDLWASQLNKFYPEHYKLVAL